MYRRFEDLKAWRKGRTYRQDIYRISKSFPVEERYALTSQIRRAAISVTANLAEGHGRYHYGENIHFCRTARGSINEVLDHLYTALDQSYIDNKEFDALYDAGREVERIVNGYIGYLEKQSRSLQKPRK